MEYCADADTKMVLTCVTYNRFVLTYILFVKRKRQKTNADLKSASAKITYINL